MGDKKTVKSKPARKSKTASGKNKEVLPSVIESNPVGRPTDFDPKYTQMLLDYFNVPPTKEIEVETLVYGVPVKRTVTVAEDFRSLAGFAVKIGKHRDTLHEWANAKDKSGKLLHPEFSDAYNRRKDFQENYILVNGLSNKITGQFAAFAAINLLGYRQKAKDEAPEAVVNNYEKVPEEQLLAQAQELFNKLGLNKK